MYTNFRFSYMWRSKRRAMTAASLQLSDNVVIGNSHRPFIYSTSSKRAKTGSMKLSYHPEQSYTGKILGLGMF